MPLKILEHCCYRKYLNNWWGEHQSRIQAFDRFVNDALEGRTPTSRPPVPEDCWSLINYGDHTLTDLLEWCVNMCWRPTPHPLHFETSQKSPGGGVSKNLSTGIQSTNGNQLPSPEEGYGGGVIVTIAMPVLTVTTLEWLAKHKGISTLNIITREPIDTTKLSIVNCKMVNVVVPDLHTQLVTITNGDRHFVLQNSLLQSVCPGKYITTLGLTHRYYDSIQPLLNSWLRLYSKRAE